METWNVVITVHEGYYRSVRELLEPLGTVRKTEFFNVQVMEVDNIQEAMETLKAMIDEEPEARAAIARFVPASQTFFFTSAEEFEEKAQEAALSWTRELEGKKFHVRMKRRGFKKRISSLEEETFLDKVLIEADKRNAERSGHLTARACGEIAQAAGVERLAPFHFSRRYEKDPLRVYNEVKWSCERIVLPKSTDIMPS